MNRLYTSIRPENNTNKTKSVNVQSTYIETKRNEIQKHTINFDGKMSPNNVPKTEPNIWRNCGDSSTNDQSHAQPNQLPPESELESEERLGLIFKRLDRNGDGRISIQELSGALKRSGMPHQYAEVSVYYHNFEDVFLFFFLIYNVNHWARDILTLLKWCCCAISTHLKIFLSRNS